MFPRLCVVIGGLALAGPAHGGQGPAAAPALPAAISRPADAGPSSPLLSRDVAGGLTLRAVRLAESLRIDGRLDESLYRDVQPISGFVQIEPQEGQAATERTDVWIAFDDDSRETFLELAPATAARPAGLTHVGIEADDVQATVTRLRRAGAQVPDPRLAGNTNATLTNVTGPDGVRVEFLQLNPESLQRKA